MNLLLVEREEISGDGRVLLTDRRAEHLVRVLGVRPGQDIRAGIVRGPFARATVVALNGGVEVEIRPTVDCEVPRTELVLALPRPKALSRIVQAAASFGLRRIDIVNAWRVDASYFSSHKVSNDALAMDARLGCEQGRQTYVPEITVHRFFSNFVREELRLRLEPDGSSRLLVLHPGAALCLEHAVTPGSREPLILAIGPDGGFLDREVETLVEAGGTVVSCGEPVLRSEIAVVAVLSQLDLLRRFRAEPT